MTQLSHATPDSDPRPPLWHDWSFHGMNFTQFFGAFNDNLFKQLVLLLCVDFFHQTGTNYQSAAALLFALPFVLFSGFAGYLSDRISKRWIVVAMKIAEIGVMAAGFWAFHAVTHRMEFLLTVVFLMGTHSAFFGPPKYGILPELFRQRDLPQVNGMIQMTTFLSIILGMALAGLIKEWYNDRLWVGSMVCIGLAVIGTLTASAIRSTPIARPGLPFTTSALFISGDTWRMLKNDRPLFVVLLVSSLFWFLGGVIQLAVNDFGKLQLDYGDARTSALLVCMAIGIMVGCLSAGAMSHGRIRSGLVKLGAWGVVACLAGLAAFGSTAGHAVRASEPTTGNSDASSIVSTESSGAPATAKSNGRAPESFTEIVAPGSFSELVYRVLLGGVGLFAGFFYVPLAVIMQVRPPADMKGRMIGAMNLINWIGILLAAVFYFAIVAACAQLHVRESWIFAFSAAVMLPVALWYRPNVQMPTQAA